MREAKPDAAASAATTTTKEMAKATQTELGSEGFTEKGFCPAEEAVSGAAASPIATERRTETPPAASVPEIAVAKSPTAPTTSGGFSGSEAEDAEVAISSRLPTENGEQGFVRRPAPTTTKKTVCCFVCLIGRVAKQKGAATTSFLCLSAPA